MVHVLISKSIYRICFCIFGDTLLAWWIFSRFSLHYGFPATRATKNRYFTEITQICYLPYLFFYNVLILAHDIIKRKQKNPFNSFPFKFKSYDWSKSQYLGKVKTFFQMENDVCICTLWTLYCFFISRKSICLGNSSAWENGHKCEQKTIYWAKMNFNRTSIRNDDTQ